MFKIDLIKELQDEAAKTESKQENLLAEANKLIVFPKNIDQERTINKIFKNLTEDIKKIELKKKLKDITNSEVITRDTIRKICKKYDLRCLSTFLFKGVIHENTAVKIQEFKKLMYYKNLNVYDDNFYIIAPAESFSLTKKPKDPILIYSYDHQYTIGLTDTNIIIDKWGNDLSLTNQAKSLIKRYYPVYTALIISLIAILINSSNSVNPITEKVLISILTYCLCIIPYAFLYTTFEEKWNSKFKAR